MAAKGTENINKEKITGRRTPRLGKHLHCKVRQKLLVQRRDQRTRSYRAAAREGERLRKETGVCSNESETAASASPLSHENSEEQWKAGRGQRRDSEESQAKTKCIVKNQPCPERGPALSWLLGGDL